MDTTTNIKRVKRTTEHTTTQQLLEAAADANKKAISAFHTACEASRQLTLHAIHERDTTGTTTCGTRNRLERALETRLATAETMHATAATFQAVLSLTADHMTTRARLDNMVAIAHEANMYDHTATPHA